jgi:hypothetical protein
LRRAKPTGSSCTQPPHGPNADPCVRSLNLPSASSSFDSLLSTPDICPRAFYLHLCHPSIVKCFLWLFLDPHMVIKLLQNVVACSLRMSPKLDCHSPHRHLQLCPRALGPHMQQDIQYQGTTPLLLRHMKCLEVFLVLLHQYSAAPRYASQIYNSRLR